jgi:gluconolactonase
VTRDTTPCDVRQDAKQDMKQDVGQDATRHALVDTVDGYDIVDPAFNALVLPNARLERLGDGFRWLEGPVWFGDHDCLLFSDLPSDRIWRWSERAGLSIQREPAGFENGHARDREGRLIGCSHRNRCITRVELDGTLTVLADRFEGRRLNSPNDVVVKRDGSIWFTDPPYGIQTDYEGGKQTSELPARVYRLDPRSGAMSIVADDFEGPNGLCFSPDESLLYIAETGLQFGTGSSAAASGSAPASRAASGDAVASAAAPGGAASGDAAPSDSAPRRHIRVFDVAADGASLGAGRVFHAVTPGHADGMRCDESGNVWSGAADGVHCIAPSGALLGKILVPETVSNLCFGGRANSRLFLCASQTLYAIYTNTRGVPMT